MLDLVKIHEEIKSIKINLFKLSKVKRTKKCVRTEI